MGYFSQRDRALVEALQYDPTLKPEYEILKGCLVWNDERPDNLTPAGYEKLCDLWIARGYIHREEPFSNNQLDPEYFGKAWEEALRDKIRWPGFLRLRLSDEDRRFYDETLRQAMTDEI